MNEGRDLAVTLIASALLLLGVSSLTQCSAASHRASTANNTAVSPSGQAERDDAAGKPKSARELDEDEGQDEREKIQRVGHALQTIGANPEMSKTLGIPQ